MTDQPVDGTATTAAAMETMPTVATSPPAGADEPTHKRRVDDDGPVSPRKKARNYQPEGEASDGVDEGEVNSDVESKASSSTKEAGHTSGWNNGVTSQLRTSFGSSSKSSVAKLPAKLIPAPPKMSPSSPEKLAPEIRSELVAAVKAGETAVLPPVEGRQQLWTVPTPKADFEGDTWDEISKSMFSQWSTDFISKNQSHVDQFGLEYKFLRRVYLGALEDSLPEVNPSLITFSTSQLNRKSKNSLLRQVAKGWTGDHPSLKEGKREQRAARERAKESQQSPEPPIRSSTRQTRSSARLAGTQVSGAGNAAVSVELESSATSPSGDALPGLPLPPPPQLASSPQSPAVVNEPCRKVHHSDENGDEKDKDYQPSDKGPDQTKAGNESSQLATEAELEQLHRYFPGVPDDAIFCLTCASFGHNTSTCPETICKFCQQGHFSYSCPSRQRCAKCKQLGHTKPSCKEKLAMAAGEGFMECAFCQAQDHQEERCSEIWETYRPQVGHIKQVRAVPTFCYCCGAEGHFGTDCGLADPNVPPSATWSNAGASLYVDPTSSEKAIAYQNPLPQAQEMSAPVIPGRSIKPQSHIIFEDSGDEDAVSQGFLRAPASGPRRPGQIQITSNINFGASAGALAHNGSDAQQGSSGSKQKRKQRAANVPASLPPKPQVAPPSHGPAPQASKKGKKNNKKGPKNSQQQQQQQQPPLPPGPPPGRNGWRPPELQGRGANSTRGRGGFSNLTRGGGGRRGGGRN